MHSDTIPACKSGGYSSQTYGLIFDILLDLWKRISVVVDVKIAIGIREIAEI